MAEPTFKIGDKVKHKSGAEFQMVIKGFAVIWKTPDAMPRMARQETNPEYPICSYYNVRTEKWEEKTFYYEELELVETAK